MILFRKKEVRKSDVKEVEKALANLHVPLVQLLMPTNYLSEKEKFFESSSYEPKFTYAQHKAAGRKRNSDSISFLKNIDSIEGVDPGIEKIYKDVIKNRALTIDLIEARGDNEKVSAISLKKYKSVKTSYFKNACLVLKGKTSLYKLSKASQNSDRVFRYEEVCDIFDQFTRAFKLDYKWVYGMSTHIGKNAIRVGTEITIDKNIEKDRFSMRKTILHEFGTHILRFYNGNLTKFPILGRPNVIGYLDIEEGLATYNEEKYGLLTEQQLKIKALYYYAIFLAQTMGFRDLFNALLGHTGKNNAFSIASRAKRGMGDTSRPGAMYKDAAYFRGFRIVRKRLFENPSQYNLLYAGKITFAHTRLVEEGVIPKPKVVLDEELFNETCKKTGLL